MSGCDQRVQQKAQRIDENVTLLAFDQLAPVKPMGIDARPPFFRALNALTIDDARGRADVAIGLLSAFDVERVVNVLQRSVVAPQTKIVVHRAARRQVFRNEAPLASGAQDIHHAVDYLAHVYAPLAAATLRRRYQRSDMLPFRVRQTWVRGHETHALNP